LATAGIPAARVNTTADVLDHPQLAEQDDGGRCPPGGRHPRVLPPMTFRDVELPMGPVPALGQHNHAILAELGLLDEDTPSKEPSDA
jgi:formyl-CoA transferase